MAKLGERENIYQATFVLTGFYSTFVTAWQASLKVHETVAESRIRFAQRLNEMSEELSTLVKEVDKNRKTVRYCRSP